MAPETVLGENILDFRPSRHRAPLSATPPERASHSPSTVPRRATKKLSHRSYWGFLISPRGGVDFPPGVRRFPPGGTCCRGTPGGTWSLSPYFGSSPRGVPRQQVPLGGQRHQKVKKGVSRIETGRIKIYTTSFVYYVCVCYDTTFWMWFKRDECVHEFHSNDYLLLQWSGNTQTRFGLVGPIISAQQPFYYNSKLHFAWLVYKWECCSWIMR